MYKIINRFFTIDFKVKVFFSNSVAIECKSMPFVELGTFNTWVSAVYMDSFVY